MGPKKRFSGLSFYIILLIVIFVMTYFMSNVPESKTYTLSEMRNLVEIEKVESVVIHGNELRMVLKSVGDQPQELITKEIPLDSVGEYEVYLADAVDKGLIESYDYSSPTDI